MSGLLSDLLKLFVEILLNQRSDVLGGLRGDETDTEVSADLGRDDSLRAGTTEGALDAV